MPTTFPRSAASRRNPNYARDAVFAAFRPRQARALNQADFQDRAPDQLPRTCAPPTGTVAELALERLAEILREAGGESCT